MPEIVGKFSASTTNMSPLEAHIGHLRHLSNATVARELLRREFNFTATDARPESERFCAHINQSLRFHEDSKVASIQVRPVLQYYSYLNLAVAAIRAYRPQNYDQTRQHGVEDSSHSLRRLNLNSNVLKVKRGAVPLFHAILSDVELKDRSFQVGDLAAGIHMLSYEMQNTFGKHTQSIYVTDSVEQEEGQFVSQLKFTSTINNINKPISYKRLETAMPKLTTEYTRDRSSKNPIVYKSITKWRSAANAERTHRKNCLKLINYGGHVVANFGGEISSQYAWIGLSRVPLLPTLTSLLLFSFSLASLVRYRPVLLESALDSPVHLLIGTFVQESDGVFFPSLRNLLYRQESCFGPSVFT